MAVAAIGQINVSEYPKGARTIDRYEKLEQVGEGTYGQVYKARDKRTGEIVALKKLRLDIEPEGFPMTAIREVRILSRLDHANVIKLKETVTSPGPERDRPDGNKYKGGIYLVFEYMEHDLAGLTNRRGGFLTAPQIKLLLGLHYCHANKILHRDIKASNLLINNEGILKLADFGLAKSIAGIHSDSKLTNRVITLWYRPPELLLGATHYGPAVDIWSAGCILAELIIGKCIFNGRNEVEVLNHIFELCGAPDDRNWPGVSNLPFYTRLKPSRPMRRRLGEVYKHFEKHALELLERMLTLDPNQRISARDALDADYFWTDPLPSNPNSLPKYESSHFYETRKKRLQHKLQVESANSQKMPPPKTQYGSQPASSSLRRHSSGPYPPPSQERSSAGSHSGGGVSIHPIGGPYIPHGYGSSHGSRDMPSSGSYGARGSGSGYRGGAPNFPQGYGSSHEFRDMPSSVSRGAGGSGSGYGGGAPNDPQEYGLSRGSRDVPSSGFHGGGGSGSAYGGGDPNYPPGYRPSHGSRDVISSGSHGGGGSGSAYGGGGPNYPQGCGLSHGSRDMPSSGFQGGGRDPDYPPGYRPSHGSRDVPSSGSYDGGRGFRGYGGGAPNYSQRYGLSHGSRDMPSSGFHGEGGDPNYPPGYGPSHGSRDVPSSDSHGGGRGRSGSGYGGGAPSQPQGGSSSIDGTKI